MNILLQQLEYTQMYVYFLDYHANTSLYFLEPASQCTDCNIFVNYYIFNFVKGISVMSYESIGCGIQF